MHYAYRYRLHPTEIQQEKLDSHRDTCRQLYNHALNEFEQIPESAGTLNQRVRQVRDHIPDLKDCLLPITQYCSVSSIKSGMRKSDQSNFHQYIPKIREVSMKLLEKLS
jgi:putative transposase